MLINTKLPIFDAISNQRASQILGANSGGRAWIIAQWAIKSDSLLFTLCSHDEEAINLQKDVSFYYELITGRSLRTAGFHSGEQSPYSSIAPSIRTRLSRIAVLNQLQSGTQPQVLFSSVAALAQATLPLGIHRELSRNLSKDQSISPVELISQLQSMAYQRTETVEDPGTFAHRGDLVDIFPPDRTYPVRIEFFGDEIERLREFAPQSQRSLNDISELTLGPAREVIINQSNSEYMRQSIKDFADNRSIQRKFRDPVIDALRNHQYTERSDSWAAFAYPSPGRLLDYLPAKTRFILIDELSINQTADQLFLDNGTFFEESIKENLITPAPAQFYCNFNTITEITNNNTPLVFNSVKLHQEGDWPQQEANPDIESAENPDTDYRLQTKANSDLKSASKDSLGELEEKITQWCEQHYSIIITAKTDSQLQRIKFLLNERKITSTIGNQNLPSPDKILLVQGEISEGFRWPAEKIAVISEQEFFGIRRARNDLQSQKRKYQDNPDWSQVSALSDLNDGDMIVHYTHGIGRYAGITRLTHALAEADYIQIEYADKDRLYLPVYRMDLLSKYIGGQQSTALDKLGGNQFEKTKQKVKEGLKRLAFDLVELYAKREMQKGIIMPIPDSTYREFEGKFPFHETHDQITSIEAVLGDLHSGRIMDRIICGDVGYGKTEIAMRAAFHVALSGHQVAVIVPTTILAHQHEESFKQRFKDYPFKIDSLSRFKNQKDQRRITSELSQGKIDIIIGTHRLLSRDVEFQRLGLIIVDEEHRFGVEHKEKLKTIRLDCHVLTLTATPIPRTLHMALSGLRDISLITTPPVDRMPIRTYVSKYDEALIQRAIRFELNRGGQVFFLHNRVQTIEKMAADLRELIPEAKIGIAHGQMSEGTLEKQMMSFYQKEFNILLCTTIIESGLDVSSANTIIIDRADTFGLAQLYQLRGRVGRSDRRAYAYLLIHSTGHMTEDARQRLDVIQRFVELGSGFNIASHDLEIRGGGNILGAQQSGNVAAVGLEIYTQLLEEAIAEMRGKPLDTSQMNQSLDPEISTPYSCFLHQDYIPDTHQRLSLYRRLASTHNDEELRQLEEEMVDRFGKLPSEALNLLWIIRLKQRLRTLGVVSLKAGPQRISLTLGKTHNFAPDKAVNLMSTKPQIFQILPQNKMVITLEFQSLRDLYFKLDEIFSQLVSSK